MRLFASPPRTHNVAFYPALIPIVTVRGPSQMITCYIPADEDSTKFASISKRFHDFQRFFTHKSEEGKKAMFSVERGWGLWQNENPEGRKMMKHILMYTWTDHDAQEAYMLEHDGEVFRKLLNDPLAEAVQLGGKVAEMELLFEPIRESVQEPTGELAQEHVQGNTKETQETSKSLRRKVKEKYDRSCQPM